MITAFLLTVLFCNWAFADDIILKPIKSASKEIGIVWVQGTRYNPDQFVGLLQEMQASSEVSLWAAIPQFENNIVEANKIPAGVSRCLTKMKENGMRTSVIFYAGEYVGGAYLQEYVLNNGNASGLILLGSFLSRDTWLKFPIPSLTIGGGRDGLVRVTHMMEAYYHQVIQSSLTLDEICRKQAVVVLEQLTHAQFADGSAPSGIKGVDFQPVLSIEAAHRAIGGLLAAFVDAHVGIVNNLYKLQSAIKVSGNFLEPLVKAFTMEGYYYFKPPCYDNVPSSSCVVGCGWTEQAMIVMAGLKNAIVNDTDGFHPVSEIKHIHHPQIINTCSHDLSNCTLDVISVSENVYLKADKYDSGTVNASAIEIRAKLRSRQAAMEAVGYKNVKFNATDGGSLCGQINDAALRWSISITGNNTLADYMHNGQHLVIGEDKGPYNIFPEWEAKSLEFVPSKQDGKPVMVVHAIMMRMPTKYLVPAFAGMHYCKLLSPARVIEWIYIDSRRLSETIQ